MRQRCFKPNSSGYSKYGAKGIKVCSLWDQSFEAFRDWAYANGYSDVLTIDRVNPKGNYEPENCRWVNQKVQQNNRSNNVHLTYKGQTHSLIEWCEITGMSYKQIYDRYRRGWTVERLMEQPLRKSK